MAISPQQLTIYLYSAHRAVIFAIAQLSCHINYTAELLADTDCPRFNMEIWKAALHQWDDRRSENVFTYRDNCFKSPVTGMMSRLHHTPWKDAFDDSLECYLRD